MSEKQEKVIFTARSWVDPAALGDDEKALKISVTVERAKEIYDVADEICDVFHDWLYRSDFPSEHRRRLYRLHEKLLKGLYDDRK